MASVAQVVQEVGRRQGQLVATALADVPAQLAEISALIAGLKDRATVTAGITNIEAANYLRFIALKDQTVRTPEFSLVFDSFLIQRVSRQKPEAFRVQYTIGQPVIDVFHSDVELISVNATIPDTKPFYTLSDGVATGYLGESLEALKAVYNKYFRATGAIGDGTEVVGLVEFWTKGRVDRGYLVRLVFDRTATQLDHAEMSFDMFVARSSFKNVKKPDGRLK